MGSFRRHLQIETEWWAELSLVVVLASCIMSISLHYTWCIAYQFMCTFYHLFFYPRASN